MIFDPLIFASCTNACFLLPAKTDTPLYLSHVWKGTQTRWSLICCCHLVKGAGTFFDVANDNFQNCFSTHFLRRWSEHQKNGKELFSFVGVSGEKEANYSLKLLGRNTFRMRKLEGSPELFCLAWS